MIIIIIIVGCRKYRRGTSVAEGGSPPPVLRRGKVYTVAELGGPPPLVHLQKKISGFMGVGGAVAPRNFSAAGENFENYVIKNTFSL